MGGGKDSGTDVERLVGRVAAGAEDDPRWSALLRVLTAASRGADLDPDREQAAVRAFRAAANTRPARGVRNRRRPPRSARALAGGLAAVLALCGVAVAAGAGVLPARSHTAHGGPPPAPVARTATAPAPASPAPDATRRPAPAQPPGADRTPGTVQPSPRGTRTPVPPRAKAMCRAYLAAASDGRRTAVEPDERLRRAAGGSRRVAAYCRALLSGGPGTGGDGTRDDGTRDDATRDDPTGST
ncbi:hypothetical protein [Actinacidiphila bryophytorum]|uniref:Uncharacterized protein n=1 Tax=Actinacidiphila bryophytorum TaxID=1436133 RepID=A0A9W4H6P5_9ACTN|nr:hypothetical protein [Actinacidiphila bryophytorum]MBM9437508.1 hypothetical protein [Actinacidiphila bryophytorum]CAG7656119.1 conserved hypothetical protein [Actinacidiphila bryophytorum]